jgi:hypothetical protein
MATIKPGASIRGISPEMAIAWPIIVGVFNAAGYNPVLTSGTDGKHGRYTLHNHGYALDLRSWHIKSRDEKQAILRTLKARLGGEFDVLWHDGTEPKIKEHYHIEFDHRP